MRCFRQELREAVIQIAAPDIDSHFKMLDAYDPDYKRSGEYELDPLDDIIYGIARKKWTDESSENRLFFTYFELYRCRDLNKVLEIFENNGMKVQYSTVARYCRDVKEEIKSTVTKNEKIKKEVRKHAKCGLTD